MNEQKFKKVHQNAKDKELGMQDNKQNKQERSGDDGVFLLTPGAVDDDDESTVELWKLISTHMRQLTTLKAMTASTVADIFGGALLNHMPNDQRAQRKLRELLLSTCGASSESSSPKKDVSASSAAVLTASSGSPTRRGGGASTTAAGAGATPSSSSSPDKSVASDASSSLLQMAFLQTPGATRTGATTTT